MRVVFFNTKAYDRTFFNEANARHEHELTFLETHLDSTHATLAHGAPAVCAFVNDRIDRETLELLHAGGTRLVALRCAGFNNVDLAAAGQLGITVARVPAYSPHAVAEHAVALLLSLNRKLHRAYARVREANFSLNGLLGFDVNRRSVGVVGMGQIGRVFAQIMLGFGCPVLAYDPNPAPALPGVQYVSLDQLLGTAQIISLHCPLNASTRHLINERALERMQHGVVLINTGRGALVDTQALIAGLKSGKIGGLGLDVYEEEEALFFEDHSTDIIQDDVFMRLLTFPNVLITAHQGFFTEEALRSIAEITLENVSAFARGDSSLHVVGA